MPNSLRRPSGLIAAFALSALALILASSTPAPASTSILPPGAIAPSDRQRLIANTVGEILEEAHFSRASIDDRMSAVVYDRYLDFLDGQRSYFLASDLQEFSLWRLRFDDMIRTGDIDPAYAIFARFQQRNRERMQSLRVRARQGAVAGDRRRDGRALAQAGEERCPLAAAHRQALD
jgi:carboxyl-terminal processing protease